MSIFKTFTMKWWQAVCFKWGLLAMGISIGAYWHEIFSGYLIALIAVAVVSLGYVTYVWWQE